MLCSNSTYKCSLCNSIYSNGANLAFIILCYVFNVCGKTTLAYFWSLPLYKWFSLMWQIFVGACDSPVYSLSEPVAHFSLTGHVCVISVYLIQCYSGRPFWLQLQSARLSSAQSTVSSATGCRDIPMKGETVRGKCDISTAELRSVFLSLISAGLSVLLSIRVKSCKRTRFACACLVTVWPKARWPTFLSNAACKLASSG